LSHYRFLFKSTAFLGGTQVILTVIGLVRNKALALLLGPAGIGLAGLFSSITTLVGTITSFGIGGSGVRQMAEANGTGDQVRVARTAIIITRVVLVSNIIGALVICLFCRPISQATFGNSKFAGGVMLMGLVQLFTGISGGQTCILQGLQRIRDLVNCQILGAVFGTVSSVAIVYFFRDRGVAMFLVANAGFAILTSWWFVRRIHFVRPPVSLAETLSEAKQLAGFGISLMASGILGSLVAYFTRIIVIHKLGLPATGQYQAAFTLSSYYVGIILGAMGSGLFPRLSGLAHDHKEANRLLNEQTEIGLLLATPGIIATLVAAPWVLQLLYTRDFVVATGIIQWQVVGVFFRMISWPLWHLQLAKGLGRVFILTESFFAGVQLLLNWVCINQWGLDGVGIAFALYYIIHIAGMWLLCRRLSGFTWSRRVFLISLPGVLILGLTFAAVKWLPMLWGVGLGVGLCLLTCAGSFHGLQKVLGVNIKTMLLKRFAPNEAG